MSDCFRLDSKITLLPVIHRSGECARQVEKWLLNQKIDCLAIPLPPSFRESVIAGVEELPSISVVVQSPIETDGWGLDGTSDFRGEMGFEGAPESKSRTEFGTEREDWTLDSENDWDEGIELTDPTDIEADASANEEYDEVPPYSFVPIDPCQPVIASIRFALGERIPVRFIDLETDIFDGEDTGVTPDAYVLKEISLDTFSAAVLTGIERPQSQQIVERIECMAIRLLELRGQFEHIVMICSIHHWPWLREAYQRLLGQTESPLIDEGVTQPAVNYSVNDNTLLFMLSELPYVTAVYEESRFEISRPESDLALDGIKRLLLSARASYIADFGKRARRITPFLLSQCLKYIRNLTLLDRRFTPDMYTIILAAKQTLGDQFALHVAETVRNYAFQETSNWPSIKMGIDRLELPDGAIVPAISRLGESHGVWRTLEINRRPLKDESNKWKMQWNPYRQCSWLPDDAKIESFRTRVLERAKAILGADLARTEKFTTSMMDGLDMRETLRHWYDGQLYVKVQPPSVGNLDACVFLFESEPDPMQYTWKTTWFAEYEWESTLAFYATDFRDEILGPGVAVATYGGAMFLFPPRSIPDIWSDPDLKFADTLEERLIAAACMHSSSRQIALLSPIAPTSAWKGIARRFGKSLVHVPLSKFSDEMVAQLRTVHVLNGQEVRSYAAHFIRQV